MARNGKVPTPVVMDQLAAIPKAVDQVSDEAANEIEATARQLIENAHEAAGKLNALAEAVRKHGKIAEEHVTKHTNDVKHTLETVARLQARYGGEPEGETIEGTTRLPDAPQLDTDHG